jgi:hypothetical protein
MLYGQVPTEAEAAMLAAAVTADAKLAEPEQYFHMLASLDRQVPSFASDRTLLCHTTPISSAFATRARTFSPA